MAQRSPLYLEGKRISMPWQLTCRAGMPLAELTIGGAPSPMSSTVTYRVRCSMRKAAGHQLEVYATAIERVSQVADA